MGPLRWTVLWANLDPARGHEQAGRRPVLVVSYEPYHASGLVTVLPVTSARISPRYPGDVAIPAGTAGLEKASVVICQPQTISVERIHGGPAGRIDDPALRQAVRAALGHHFALDVRPMLDGA